MKVTKAQLKEMIRKIVREQLQEQVTTWGQPTDLGGLGGFAKKVGIAGVQAAQQKAKSAAQAKQDLATDKTDPGGKLAYGQRQAQRKRRLQAQVQTALDTIMSDADKLEAVIKYIQSLGEK